MEAGAEGRVHVRNLSGTVVAVAARQLAALAAGGAALDAFGDAEADLLDMLALLAEDEEGSAGAGRAGALGAAEDVADWAAVVGGKDGAPGAGAAMWGVFENEDEGGDGRPCGASGGSEEGSAAGGSPQG